MPKVGPVLRAGLDGVWYLEAHPEVAEFFKQVGVYAYCEKLAYFHQQVSKTLLSHMMEEKQQWEKRSLWLMRQP
jgi:hypothetical protein